MRMRIRTRSTAKGSALLCPDPPIGPVLASARGRTVEEEETIVAATTDVGTMKNFIDGEWVEPSGGTDTVFNPATGEELAQAPVSTAGGRRPRGQGGVATRSRAGRTRRPASARSR